MKLRSSKAMLYLGMFIVVCIVPFLPVMANAATTYEQQQSTRNVTELQAASYNENVSELVAAGYDETETDLFYGKAVSIAEPYTEIRSSLDEDYDVLGRFYSGSIADVLYMDNEWTEISSGNVTGYVKSEVLCFNEEARAIAEIDGSISASVLIDSADIFSTDNTQEILATAKDGDTFTAVGLRGSYVVVLLESGERGCILSDYVFCDYGLKTAMTNEESEAYEAELEAERIAQEKAAAEEARRKAAEEAKRAEEERRSRIIANTISGTDFTYNPSMSVSDEEIWIMACIVDWESGSQCYEGKLAVANVILNRVRSSRYANTVKGVVYASGQFSGVLDANGEISSRFSQRLKNGPGNSDCTKAVLEALSGKNNIGSYTSFRAVRKVDPANYSDCVIIQDHLFF